MQEQKRIPIEVINEMNNMALSLEGPEPLIKWAIITMPYLIDCEAVAIMLVRVDTILLNCGSLGGEDWCSKSEFSARIEKEILRIARAGGLRFIGPNSMGHANTSSDFSTLAWLREIQKGPIGFISQSGTYGQRLVRTAIAAGHGFSKFISSGNEADLHLEDYLEYLAQDEETRVIALYIEGLREGRRFFRIAKEITKRKPIIALKSGRTEGSARAAKSHTATLSGSDIIYDAAFRQAGVMRVEDDDELFDVTTALLHLPFPQGRRVGILTEGGGIGVMAADACENAGLEIPQFSPATIQRLNDLLPSRWSHGNPADITDVITAGKSVTFSCLQAIMEGEDVDVVMVIGGLGAGMYFRLLIPSPSEKMVRLADLLAEEEIKGVEQLSEWMSTLQKPIVAVKLIPETVPEPEIYQVLRRKGVPVYPNPQRAAKALAHIIQHHEYIESLRQGEKVCGKGATANP